MELGTVALYGLNIKMLVLSNDEFGKITAEQQLANTHVWATQLKNPSWAGMATSLEMYGRRVETPDDLEAGMADLFAVEGPGVLDIRSSKLQY
jgi:pyruvate dehydrogenase (quinone)